MTSITNITGREFKIKYNFKLYILIHSNGFINSFNSETSVSSLRVIPTLINIFNINYIQEVILNDDSIIYFNGGIVNSVKNFKTKDKVLLKDFEMWKDLKFCYDAINTNPYNLKYSMKTKELIDLAICRNGKTIKYIDKDLQTLDLCRKAVINYRYSHYPILKYIKKEFKTYEICKIAIENIGLELEFVDNQNHDLCLSALKNNRKAFKFIKKDLQTPEMCNLAISPDYNIYNIRYIRKDLQTYDICKKVLKYSIIYLKFIRKDLINKELLSLIIKRINKN